MCPSLQSEKSIYTIDSIHLNGFLHYRKPMWNKKWRGIEMFLEGKKDVPLPTPLHLVFCPFCFFTFFCTVCCHRCGLSLRDCMRSLLCLPSVYKFSDGLLESCFSPCVGKLWLIRELLVKYRKVKSQPQAEWCVGGVSF